MLWGRGDSSKLGNDELTTLSHLRRMAETGHIVALTHDQSAVLLRALDWYTDWEGTFRTLRHIRNVLILSGFFFGGIWALGGDPIKTLIGLVP